MKTTFFSPNTLSYPAVKKTAADVLVLHCNNILRIEENQTPVRVRVVSGRVWITQEGDMEDYLLASGSEWTLNHRGLALIGAMPEARVQLIK